MEQKRTNINTKYKEILTASGLVDGIKRIELLKPLYRELAENEILCRPGDPTDCLWVVTQGTIAVRENDVTLVTRGKGSLLGEQGLLDNRGGRRLELNAVNGTAEILEISLSAIEAHPQSAQIWKNCGWILCMKLDETTEDIFEAKKKTAFYRERLKQFVGEYALSSERLASESIFSKHQRETIVLWFSDIVGFSKYASTMPPQNAASFVQRFLTPQVNAIETRKGVIDKFIGDSIMAYWIVRTKDGRLECEKALDAAIEALDKVTKIYIGDSPLTIRIGMHIGNVSLGNFGTQTRSQFTAIGHEVNKAARLEQAGQKNILTGDTLGALRVSQEFYSLLNKKKRDYLLKSTKIDAHNIGDILVYSGPK